MSKAIFLHKTKGLNPRLTVCPMCGKDSKGIALIGSRDWKDICAGCGTVHFGGADKCKCQKCGSYSLKREPIGEYERVPMTCAACEKEIAEHRKIVEEGGVYWRCADCRGGGVIGKSPFADKVREKLGIPAPNPVGAEFTAKDCPACGPKGKPNV